MLSRTIIAAGLVAATTLTAIPANAAGITLKIGKGNLEVSQNYGPRHHRGPRWRHQRLSPRELHRTLRHRGYYAIRVVDHRGPVYQVQASKRHRSYILVVSARDGDILSRHPIRRGWH